MRSKRVLGTSGVCLALVVGLVLKTGCDSGVGFLGLQDYQRDLLLGGLAAAVLLGNQGADDGGAGNPIPDVDGLVGPPGEQGLPGADGTSGVDGADGAAGPAGSAGPAGEQGAQGSVGSAGATGSAGSNGAQGADGVPGPDSLFSLFIDDFFAADATQNGNLPIELVAVAEPALAGWINRAEPPVEVVDAVAFRVGIPQKYQGGDVTMRLYFHRMFEPDGDCFAFTVDGRRLRAGVGMDAGERRWVRVEENDKAQARRQTAADALLGVTTTGRTIVIDLPINSPAGLGYYMDDLSSANFLGFELATYVSNYAMYHLLGVEFFESAAGTAQPAGATIFTEEEWDENDEICCYPDCGDCECPDDIVTDCKTQDGAVIEYERPRADGCSDLCPAGDSRLNLYSVSARDGLLRVVDENSASTLHEVLMTLPGEPLECVVGGNGLATHPATGELWALLKVQQVGECLDETKTVFAGCPERADFEDRGGPQFDDRCRRFSGDQEWCEMAYALGSDGVISCVYDGQSGECFSCGQSGPRGEGGDGAFCINTCVPEPECVDESRTIFVGGPGTGACHVFDNDQTSCENSFAMGGNGVVSCHWDGQQCRGCSSNYGGDCTNTCLAIPECDDESRTVFAGFPNSSGCDRFSGDPEGCSLAYVEGDSGVASCWYDGQTCRSCGPRHLCEGNCQNTCDPSVTVPELVCAGDPTRTNFVGCPRSEGCRQLSTQNECEASFNLGDDGIASCFWDELDQECRGCGPRNDGCACENECAIDDDPGRGERPRGGKGRLLATVHPVTGVVTPIGYTGDSFAGLAFDADATLYGVTGDGACKAESLHTLNTTTAEPTLLCKLGRGNGGEAIAYNPDDGFLYHASGHSGNCGDGGGERADDDRAGGGPNDCVIFERIDDTTGPFCETTDIDISSTALINEEAQALTYWSAEQTFLWKQDHRPGPLFTVTKEGEESEVGRMDHQAKGLAFTEGPACYVSCEPESGALFPVGESSVDCYAVPFDSALRGDEGLICSFEVDVSDDCGESLTGWWRFVFRAQDECDSEFTEDATNELRYLRFDENNELVENFITEPGPVDGLPQCLQVFYPSDNGPNYIEVRVGGELLLDTHREITTHSFDPFTGALSFTELVDVPARNCIGEEGSTFFDGQVSGDTLTGTWQFQFSEEAGFLGQCLDAANLLCGPVEAQRVDGPPECNIINAENP